LLNRSSFFEGNVMVNLKKRSSLKIAALTAVAAAGFAFGVGANAAEPLKVAFCLL
jgi:hypothetical protein